MSPGGDQRGWSCDARVKRDTEDTRQFELFCVQRTKSYCASSSECSSWWRMRELARRRRAGSNAQGPTHSHPRSYVAGCTWNCVALCGFWYLPCNIQYAHRLYLRGGSSHCDDTHCFVTGGFEAESSTFRTSASCFFFFFCNQKWHNRPEYFNELFRSLTENKGLQCEEATNHVQCLLG